MNIKLNSYKKETAQGKINNIVVNKAKHINQNQGTRNLRVI